MENELQSYFGRYIDEAEHSSGLSKVTVAGYKAVFNFFLKIMPEVTDLESLTEEMLNEYFKRIHTRRRVVGRNTPKIGVKDTTIKTHWAKLHTFFAWLKNRDLIRKNPLINIRPPSVSYEDFRRLTDKQIKEIYAAIALHSINTLVQRRDTFMVSLLLYCGLRFGEFISLLVTDIDLEKKEITIRAETSKSKSTRILRLHPTLLLHLKD
jgi:integrase/recombinase XerD